MQQVNPGDVVITTKSTDWLFSTALKPSERPERPFFGGSVQESDGEVIYFVMSCLYDVPGSKHIVRCFVITSKAIGWCWFYNDETITNYKEHIIKERFS